MQLVWLVLRLALSELLQIVTWKQDLGLIYCSLTAFYFPPVIIHQNGKVVKHQPGGCDVHGIPVKGMYTRIEWDCTFELGYLWLSEIPIYRYGLRNNKNKIKKIYSHIERLRRYRDAQFLRTITYLFLSYNLDIWYLYHTDERPWSHLFKTPLLGSTFDEDYYLNVFQKISCWDIRPDQLQCQSNMW